MWTVVHMTNTREDAEKAEEILRKENFLVRVKPISKKNQEGTCEISVPRSEAEEASSILMAHGI